MHPICGLLPGCAAFIASRGAIRVTFSANLVLAAVIKP